MRAHEAGRALRVDVSIDLPPVLGVGGQLNNTIAIGVGRHVMISRDLGDLDTPRARRGFEWTIDALCRAHRLTPDFVVADRHPGYASHRWAESSGLTLVEVQHHRAHVAACAAENGVAGQYLGVAWDGGGLGDDGSLWGGEFFVVNDRRFDRIAHLRPFRLLGGEAADRQGWRVALSMDWAARGMAVLNGRDDARALESVLTDNVRAPWSTSIGRLFDAVAALVGVHHGGGFESASALALEAAVDPHAPGSYPFVDGVAGDWEPLLDAIRRDLARGDSVGTVSARFHQTLVDWISRVADRMQIAQVVLSGGTFQNAWLQGHAVAALEARGHAVSTHRRVAVHDGGLSLGQLVLGRAGSA